MKPCAAESQGARGAWWCLPQGIGQVTGWGHQRAPRWRMCSATSAGEPVTCRMAQRTAQRRRGILLTPTPSHFD